MTIEISRDQQVLAYVFGGAIESKGARCATGRWRSSARRRGTADRWCEVGGCYCWRSAASRACRALRSIRDVDRGRARASVPRLPERADGRDHQNGEGRMTIDRVIERARATSAASVGAAADDRPPLVGPFVFFDHMYPVTTARWRCARIHTCISAPSRICSTARSCIATAWLAAADHARRDQLDERGPRHRALRASPAPRNAAACTAFSCGSACRASEDSDPRSTTTRRALPTVDERRDEGAGADRRGAWRDVAGRDAFGRSSMSMSRSKPARGSRCRPATASAQPMSSPARCSPTANASSRQDGACSRRTRIRCSKPTTRRAC